MALINCPECGKEISDKAKQCPKCGWKVKLILLRKNAEKKILEQEDKESVARSEINSIQNEDMQERNIQVETSSEHKRKNCEEKNVTERSKYWGIGIGISVGVLAFGLWSVFLVNVTTNKLMATMNSSSTGAEIDKFDEKSIEQVSEVEIVEGDKEQENIVDVKVSEEIISEPIEVSYTNLDMGYIQPRLFLLIKNNTDKVINVNLGEIYLNDIHVLRYGANYTNEIKPGKTNQCEIIYTKENLTPIMGNILNKMEVELYINDKDKKREPTSYVLENLAIEVED